jgi:hypothetical protein
MTEMFKRGWLRRNRIYSDEGFTIDIADRFAVIYHEGKRRMSVAAEMLTDGFALSPSSIGHWDGDPEHTIDDRKKHEIVRNIRRALESQGERVILT